MAWRLLLVTQDPAWKRGFRRHPMKAVAIVAFALTLATSAAAFAEPVTVKFIEGVTHAFPVLRSAGG